MKHHAKFMRVDTFYNGTTLTINNVIFAEFNEEGLHYIRINDDYELIDGLTTYNAMKYAYIIDEWNETLEEWDGVTVISYNRNWFDDLRDEVEEELNELTEGLHI